MSEAMTEERLAEITEYLLDEATAGCFCCEVGRELLAEVNRLREENKMLAMSPIDLKIALQRIVNQYAREATAPELFQGRRKQADDGWYDS